MEPGGELLANCDLRRVIERVFCEGTLQYSAIPAEEDGIEGTGCCSLELAAEELGNALDNGCDGGRLRPFEEPTGVHTG